MTEIPPKTPNHTTLFKPDADCENQTDHGVVRTHLVILAADRTTLGVDDHPRAAHFAAAKEVSNRGDNETGGDRGRR